MTEAPAELPAENLLQLEGDWGFNNKPWKSGGYKWDQSNLPKFYSVHDSHSYISPYD